MLERFFRKALIALLFVSVPGSLFVLALGVRAAYDAAGYFGLFSAAVVTAVACLGIGSLFDQRMNQTLPRHSHQTPAPPSRQ